MKIINFSVVKFRSFSNKVKVNLESPVVIVGPNNGGKSSLCDALEIFFSEIQSRPHFIGPRRFYKRNRYNLDRDYPKDLLMNKGRKWPTEFEAEFQFDVNELLHIKNILKIDLQADRIKVNLRYNYKKERLVASVDKLEIEQSYTLLRYISETYKTTFIPAIRDGERLTRLLNDVLNETLNKKLSSSKKLAAIQKSLNDLSSKHIQNLKKEITGQIRTFLDTVNNIEIEYDLDLSKSVRIRDIHIDDGSKTSIDLKGDGTKNLLLLGHLAADADSETIGTANSRLVVIEEPESHLNSSYLYSLKSKIDNLSDKTQVILTTHSPVFVDMYGKSLVYAATQGKLVKSPSRKEVANMLGVRLGENLSSNEYLILTEGSEDERTLKTLLQLETGDNEIISHVDFLSAHGAGNIHYLYQANKNFYKKIIAVLDHDNAGLQSVNNLKSFKFPETNIFLVPLPLGFSEFEMEDLIDLEWSIDLLSDAYGRTLSAETASNIKNKVKAKFSSWIVSYLKNQSVPIESKETVKSTLWDKIGQESVIKLAPEGKTFLTALISALKSKSD